MYKRSVSRPMTIIILLLIIALIGICSMLKIPQTFLPDRNPPSALVTLSYKGAAPEEMERLVTVPMEKVLSTVEGIKQLYSTSGEGVSTVTLEFDRSIKVDTALPEIREKLSLMQDHLPENAEAPIVYKMNRDEIPVVQLFAVSDMDLASLNDHVEKNVKPALEQVLGIAYVDVRGGADKVVLIEFNPEKLKHYGFTRSDIDEILSPENPSLSHAVISKGFYQFLVHISGGWKNVDELKDIPIITAKGESIHLRDVANVVEQSPQRDTISRINGKDGICVSIYKASDANTVQVSENIKAAVKDFESRDSQVGYITGFDQGDYIKGSISSAVISAGAGIILALITLLFFIGSVWSTWLMTLSAFLSVLVTFAVMNRLNMPLNIISLCGLILAFTMILNSSVVALEKMRANYKQGSGLPYDFIFVGRQVVISFADNSLFGAAVGIAIALSGGLAGTLFRDWGLVIVFALLAAIAISSAVMPQFCATSLTSTASRDYVQIGRLFYKRRMIPPFTRFMESLAARYESLLPGILNGRKKVLAFCLILFLLPIPLLGFIGTEFLPATDEGTFVITIEMPHGTPLTDQESLLNQFEDAILQIPELDHVTVLTGGFSPFYSDDSSTIRVMLKDRGIGKESTKEIMNQVEAQFSQIPGAKVTFEEGFPIDASMKRRDIRLTFLEDDREVLNMAVSQLTEKVAEIPRIIEGKIDSEEHKSGVYITLNQDAAEAYGITPYDFADELSSILSSGGIRSLVWVNGQRIHLSFDSNQLYGDFIEQINRVPIHTPVGEKVPVEELGKLEYYSSSFVINRQNQQNMINLDIDVEGTDLRMPFKAVQKTIESAQLPDGVIYQVGGMQGQIIGVFPSLLIALMVSVLLIYFVLAGRFESLLLPFVILISSVPFVFSGGLFALFITGKAISTTAMAGMIFSMAISVNNGKILQAAIMEERNKVGRTAAIFSGGRLSFRGILRNAFLSCVIVLPFALGIGEGMEILSPVGVVVIGGTIASTISTLLLVPILYLLVDDDNRKHEEHRNWKRTVNLYREAIWLTKEAAKDNKE